MNETTNDIIPVMVAPKKYRVTLEFDTYEQAAAAFQAATLGARKAERTYGGFLYVETRDGDIINFKAARR